MGEKRNLIQPWQIYQIDLFRWPNSRTIDNIVSMLSGGVGGKQVDGHSGLTTVFVSPILYVYIYTIGIEKCPLSKRSPSEIEI